MIKIFRNMKSRDVWLSVLCLLLVCGQVYFDLKLPDYTAEITVLISSEVTEMSEYITSGAKMLGCALCSALLTVVVGFFAARIASDFSFDVREKLFRKVSAFGSAEIKKFSTASLITRTTNDITQIQMIIAMGLQMMLRAPIMAIWAIIKIVGKSWQLSAVVAAAVAVVVVSLVVLLTVMIPKFRIVQKQIDDVNRLTEENLSGIRVVRAFNAEKYQEDKFETANSNLMRTQLFTGRGMAFLSPIMMFVQSAVSVGIYYTWLFEGTVRENLVYNTEGVTEEQMIQACKARGIHHFISALPHGYDTVLSDNTAISAGQKQLMTIARAMIQNSPMLILDEATSSVDTRTEIITQQAMDKLTSNRTSFVIAHRLSTIKNADIILVMRGGDIVEQGNHEELLAKGGFYAELYNSQFEETEDSCLTER